MDRKVTVRFYEISGTKQGGRTFEDILREIDGIPDKVARQKDVAEGCTVRLEGMGENNGLIVGDITRVQSQNLPPEVTDDGTSDLPVDRIGHEVAFCYDPETKIAALQFDQKAVTVGRFCTYASLFHRGSLFAPMPVLNRGAWEEFERETPRRMVVQIARVENFAHLGRNRTGFEDQISDWANRFDSPVVEIGFRARGKDGHLDPEETKSTIRRWLDIAQEIAGVKKVQAETLEADEAYNFLKQLLKESSTLDLPRNTEQRRTIRMNYVRSCYERHRATFREDYVNPLNT